MPGTVDLTDNNCHIAGWLRKTRHRGDTDDQRQTIRRGKEWIPTNGKQPSVCLCLRKCCKCAIVCAPRASADSSQEICRLWTMQQRAECLLLSVTCQMTTDQPANGDWSQSQTVTEGTRKKMLPLLLRCREDATWWETKRWQSCNWTFYWFIIICLFFLTIWRLHSECSQASFIGPYN